MFFENQYQLAYVTTDVGRAADSLKARFGVPEFKGLTGENFIENRVWTPEGDADIAMRIAIATVGSLTIELLEPVSGATGIFTDMLEPGVPLRLHHIAMRCEDVDVVRAEHEKLGRKVVMAGGYKTARFIYVDTRAELGHYMEYASAPPEFWRR